MHYFLLRDIQHYVLYLFPAFITVLVLAAGLGFTAFRRRKGGDGEAEIHRVYVDDIADSKRPFPLVLILAIGGAVLWAFFYILFIGLMEVKI